jgi:mRNA interferase MazF
VIVISHDGFNQTPRWRSIIVVPISTSASQGSRGPTVVEIPAGAGGLLHQDAKGEAWEDLKKVLHFIYD